MSSQPSLLVIDDDLGTRETFERVLRRAGLAVTTAESGEEGIRLAQSLRPDLLLIDLRLPRMDGIDVVKALRRGGDHSPFILMSHWNDTATTVEAMRLGALDVLDKSQDIDELVAAIRTSLARLALTASTSRPGPGRSTPAEPRSAAERWAWCILQACDADRDLKTNEALADWLDLRLSTFEELCRFVGIRPHDARDLARMLRVVVQSGDQPLRFEILLDFSEQRTLDRLRERAGLTAGAVPGPVSIERFLQQQRFVPQDNEGLKVVRAAFRRPES